MISCRLISRICRSSCDAGFIGVSRAFTGGASFPVGVCLHCPLLEGARN
jgi:hypothetical protein